MEEEIDYKRKYEEKELQLHLLREEKDNEIKKLERQIKIKNAYLILINDIAYDYDGCNTIESLKGLIDELVKMNTQALKNDDWTVMYTDLSQTKNRNILQELLDERNNTNGN